MDFYCPSYKLAMRIDGITHCTPEEIKHDKERQHYLEEFGVRFLRFRNRDVLENLDWVLEAIAERIEKEEKGDSASH